MYAERPECDFTPVLPRFTKPIPCQCCGQVTVSPHFKVKEIGRSTMQYAFCGEACAVKYYGG